MVLLLLRIYHWGIEYSYLNVIDECQIINIHSDRLRLFFGEGFEANTILYNEDIWPYKVVTHKNIRVIKSNSGEFITISDEIKRILSDIKSEWKREPGISQAVLMVPTFFNSATRRSMQTAFHSNDIQLIETLNATSALIANCSNIVRQQHKKYILAFDLESGEATIFNNENDEIIASCEIFELKLTHTHMLYYVFDKFKNSINRDTIQFNTLKYFETFSILQCIKTIDSKIWNNLIVTITKNPLIDRTFTLKFTQTEKDKAQKVFQSRVIKIVDDLIEGNKIMRTNITDVIFCNAPTYLSSNSSNFLKNIYDGKIIPGDTYHLETYKKIYNLILNEFSNTEITNNMNPIDASPPSNSKRKQNELSQVDMVRLEECPCSFVGISGNPETTKMVYKALYRNDLLIETCNEVQRLKIKIAELEILANNQRDRLKYMMEFLDDELDKLKRDKANSESQTESPKLNVEEKNDNSTDDKAEVDIQLTDLKTQQSNDEVAESKHQIGGVDLTQKRCKAALVDRPQSPIWEATSELEINPGNLLLTYNDLRNATNINSAVIAVDGDITEDDRRNLVYSAAMSRVSVLRVVNDTTAIIAAYGCNNDQKNHCILMLDVNDRRFKITAVKIEGDQTKTLLNAVNDQFTEMQFDEAALKYCCEVFYNDNDLNLLTIDTDSSKAARQQLIDACKEARKRLLYFDPTRIDIGYMYFDLSFAIKFSKTTCFHILGKYLDGIPTYISKCLLRKEIQRQEITDVILVGDFAPFFEHFVEEKFPRAVIHQTQDSDEIVARGAAILAKAALENPNPNFDQFIEPKQSPNKYKFD